MKKNYEIQNDTFLRQHQATYVDNILLIEIIKITKSLYNIVDRTLNIKNLEL